MEGGENDNCLGLGQKIPKGGQKWSLGTCFQNQKRLSWPATHGISQNVCI